MARVRDVSIDEVPEDAKPVYQRFADEYGPFLNQVKIFAHRPIALRHLMGMLLEMADNPILDKRHLEIAIVTVWQSIVVIIVLPIMARVCLILDCHGRLLTEFWMRIARGLIR